MLIILKNVAVRWLEMSFLRQNGAHRHRLLAGVIDIRLSASSGGIVGGARAR